MKRGFQKSQRNHRNFPFKRYKTAYHESRKIHINEEKVDTVRWREDPESYKDKRKGTLLFFCRFCNFPFYFNVPLITRDLYAIEPQVIRLAAV